MAEEAANVVVPTGLAAALDSIQGNLDNKKIPRTFVSRPLYDLCTTSRIMAVALTVVAVAAAPAVEGMAMVD